jgi:hypothetical protein
MKTPSIVDVPGEIRTEHLPSTSLEPYRFAITFSFMFIIPRTVMILKLRLRTCSCGGVESIGWA